MGEDGAHGSQRQEMWLGLPLSLGYIESLGRAQRFTLNWFWLLTLQRDLHA